MPLFFPAPSTGTAMPPQLRLPLPLQLRLPRRASHHPRLLLLPAAAAASLPPPPPADALLPDQATGLVAASQANFMRVIVGSTPPGLEHHQGTDLLCVVRALLKKIRRRVLVGDRVLVGAVDWADRRGVIEDVFQRRSEVVDPPVANVDRLVVLFSLDQPQPEPATLTRFLVEAESTGIPFVLVFNKVELVDEQTKSYWRDRLKSWGYDPLFLSVDQRSGLAALEEMLEAQTTVVVGPSGVGKSSLINALRCNQNIPEEDPIHQLVEQIRKMLEENEPSKCTFNDCVHLGEHGCVVKGDWERYPYYLQLLDEIKIRESFQLRTFGTKREGDVRYKTGSMGVKQAEPRLQLKKHRRVSRKKMNQSILDDMDDEMDDTDDDYQFGVSRRASKR
ncbi:hypothetical protein BRADI_5g07710v3 [Brachypodium distachyon]|uniref:EngC GTPase domain-containing protein n=1 Tax=Brachypodium distachyon TaxID=15368 RepID=A0A0Q3I818_BRADI|nr:hypothetical protein BRADI_5g07710v3 [Brachypodium distachyon]